MDGQVEEQYQEEIQYGQKGMPDLLNIIEFTFRDFLTLRITGEKNLKKIDMIFDVFFLLGIKQSEDNQNFITDFHSNIK